MNPFASLGTPIGREEEMDAVELPLRGFEGDDFLGVLGHGNPRSRRHWRLSQPGRVVLQTRFQVKAARTFSKDGSRSLPLEHHDILMRQRGLGVPGLDREMTLPFPLDIVDGLEGTAIIFR